jgi:hypothetical protein
MSLFDFIATELSSEEKKELFSDKTMCLCLFRVAFSPLKQQLLYKLLFLDPLDDSQAFKPKEFAERFLLTDK